MGQILVARSVTHQVWPVTYFDFCRPGQRATCADLDLPPTYDPRPTSEFSTLFCDVPQGSILGLNLFTLYNFSWLVDLKEFPQMSFVCWWHPAVHLFHSYKLCSLSWISLPPLSLLDELEQTAPSKTDFFLIGTKQQSLKFSNLTNLSLSNDIILAVSSSACNLDFIFDSDMSSCDHINSVSKSCHFHMQDIEQKEENDWLKKCTRMNVTEVVGRGAPRKTWSCIKRPQWSCRRIPWNKGSKIGWLLELQNLECDSSNLEIYSVMNKKLMKIRKNRRYAVKTRFFSNDLRECILNKL